MSGRNRTRWTRTTSCANGEEDRDTRVRCTRREEGDARRDRSVPARNSYRWVSPRPRPPPTPGEIYLPFRSSILFLHSCYPSSLSSFPHSYALIKFNNFCATRALCVLFALFPPPPSSPLSLSPVYSEPIPPPVVLSAYSQSLLPASATPLGLCHVINLCGGSLAHYHRAATTEYRRFMTGTC